MGRDPFSPSTRAEAHDRARVAIDQSPRASSARRSPDQPPASLRSATHAVARLEPRPAQATRPSHSAPQTKASLPLSVAALRFTAHSCISLSELLVRRWSLRLDRTTSNVAPRRMRVVPTRRSADSRQRPPKRVPSRRPTRVTTNVCAPMAITSGTSGNRSGPALTPIASSSKLILGDVRMVVEFRHGDP